jgi:hypothetical protein
MDGARAQEDGGLEGDCETLANSWSIGSIVGCLGLLRFKHRETLLLLITW